MRNISIFVLNILLLSGKILMSCPYWYNKKTTITVCFIKQGGVRYYQEFAQVTPHTATRLVPQSAVCRWQSYGSNWHIVCWPAFDCIWNNLQKYHVSQDRPRKLYSVT